MLELPSRAERRGIEKNDPLFKKGFFFFLPILILRW